MDAKSKLINRIKDVEWTMFSNVKNTGGRASCQDDPETFEVMRSSQFLSWSEDCLRSYLNDLKQAEEQDNNLMTEKYARMMKSTMPREFANIKHLIQNRSREVLQLINKIVETELSWEESFSKKFPQISGRGRPLHSQHDGPSTISTETYLQAELETYSKRTLELYYRDILKKKTKGINRCELVYENQMKRYGFNSLEEAEEFLEKKGRKV